MKIIYPFQNFQLWEMEKNYIVIGSMEKKIKLFQWKKKLI